MPKISLIVRLLAIQLCEKFHRLSVSWIVRLLNRPTIKGALAKHGVSERVFRRRRWIAELAVLDHPRLLDLVKRELGANGRIKVEAANDAEQ